MFLSRMYLNPQRRKTVELLASPQKMHAAVMATSPDLPGGPEGRKLWRCDRDGQRVVLYVVSPDAPSFEHLQEQAGWSQQETWKTRNYEQLLGQLTEGQRYAFRLTANPVHTVTDSQGKKTLYGHETPEYQMGWLMERQERMGISIPVVDDLPLVRVVGGKKVSFRRQNSRVTIQYATYEGLLDVAEADALREVLCSGIGKAKAYGCGLMTLAPVDQ